MNKLLILCGLVMLGTTTITEESQQENFENQVVYTNNVEVYKAVEKLYESTTEPERRTPKFIATVDSHKEVLFLNEINFIDIEDEEEVDLGFDTSDYLPEGFDAFEVYFDIHSVAFEEFEEEDELSLDFSQYLPENFNAYTAVVSLESINYIEVEDLEVVDLGFNTADYLPEGFNPYERHFDLNSITYIEDDDLEDVDLGFDTAPYLPKDFDPYAVKKIK